MSGWGKCCLCSCNHWSFLLLIVLIMSCLTWVWLSSKENQNKFQKLLAHMDSLTNIYNRYGFDELAEKMIAKKSEVTFCSRTP